MAQEDGKRERERRRKRKKESRRYICKKKKPRTDDTRNVKCQMRAEQHVKKIRQNIAIWQLRSRRPCVKIATLSQQLWAHSADSLFIYLLFFLFLISSTRKCLVQLLGISECIRSASATRYGYDRLSTLVGANYVVRRSINLICQRWTRWCSLGAADSHFRSLPQIVVADHRALV